MPNQLIHEKSPYLLQHAHNPVNWHAWSEETFARAAAENKPVFLSIGYATCHWCHVMERESFEDKEVAAELNDGFVSIKVDREERPDVDSVYMAVCQMMTGGGGWPLNIFMTPEKKPFFAATYIPRTSRFGRVGMIELCGRIRELWQDQPAKIAESAQSVAAALERAFETGESAEPDETVLDRAYEQLAAGYDRVNGGFEKAPKFPTPHRLSFLLRCHDRRPDSNALKMATHTLDAMRMGGMWDHVGHGFHRYSTDDGWLLPHFEKMLYDQAMISLAYLEAYQITANRRYASTAENIFDYVLRDMTADSGGFYSAEDADSEGEEGRFYVWTEAEIKEVLGAGKADRWIKIFNILPEGNYTDEATGKKTGSNILHLDKDLDQWADSLDMPAEDLRAEWQAVRQALLERRSSRVRPLLDDKILCDWNGLMIAALATGGRVLQKPMLTEAAEKAAAFIHEKMRNGDGRLFHRFRQGDLAVAAQAADYAYLTYGLLNLYHSTLNLSYAERARELQAKMIADFWDDAGGGFFLTSAEGTELPVRPKDFYDGAIPSANSVAMMNLLTLARLTGDSRWESYSGKLAAAFGDSANAHPTGFTFFLSALDFALRPDQEVVISGNAELTDTRRLIAALQKRFTPNTVVMLKTEDNADRLANFAGYTDGLPLVRNTTAAHMCKGFACRDSTADIQTLIGELEKSAREKA